MSAAAIRKCGALLGAFIRCILASRTEGTACRHLERTRNVSLKDDTRSRSRHVGIRDRNGGEKGLRVWMFRVVVQLVGVRYLDYLAEVHYGDTL